MNATAPPEAEKPAAPAMDPAVVHAALHRWLRFYIRKRRSFLHHLGLVTGVAAAAGAVAVFCAADAAIGLPVWLRWLLLAVCAGLFLTSLISGLRAAARIQRQGALDEIEAMIPVHGQMVRTALEQDGGAPSGHALKDLLRRELISGAWRVTRDFQPESGIPWKRLHRRWLMAAAAVGLCAALAAGWNDFPAALRRLGNPSGGMTFTRLAFVNPPEVFIAGQEVSVEVRMEGRTAGAPVLTIRRAGQPEDSLEMTPRGGSVFTAPLGRPDQPDTALTLTATSGDGSTGGLTIPVLYPPKILETVVELTFPAYTGLPPVKRNSPDGEVVEGTRAVFTLRTDRPLEKGRVIFSDGTDLAVSLVDGTVTFPVLIRRGDMSWRLEAADSRGLKPEKASGQWRGLEDTPPRLEWVSPKKDIEATPLAEVALKVRAADDFGLRETGMVLLAGGKERVLKTEDFGDAVPVSAVVEALAALENEKVDIRGNVKIFAYARDRFPAPAGRERRGVSDLRNIDIRQFKVWRMMAGGGAGAEELNPVELKAVVKLEDLIRDQRVVVNAIFHMKEENAAPPAVCEPMSEKEAALGKGAGELKALMLELDFPKDDVLLLDTASQQMAEASGTLKALDIPGSWTHADGALTSLLELRREFMKILHHGAGPEGAAPADDFQLPSLTWLAKEAERLAGEEEEIAKAVPGSRDKAEAAGKVQVRQAEAQADAGELFDTVVGHPEVTGLARSRMGEAEKGMTAAGLALRERRFDGALPALAGAAADLRELARHLLGLETKRAAETLKQAAEMAKAAAAAAAADPGKTGKEGENRKEGKERQEDKDGKEESGEPRKEVAGQGKAPEGKDAPEGGKAGDSGESGTGKAAAARDAAVIDDWLESLAGNGELGKAGERLGKLREDLKVPGLSGRLETLAKDGGGSGGAEESAGPAAEGKALAEALGKLSESLMAEHDRMVEGMLEKLANAQAAAKALAGKGEGKGQQKAETPAPAGGNQKSPGSGPGAEGQGRAVPSQNPVMPGTRELADQLEELHDAELAELGRKLEPLKDPRYNTDLRESTLEKIEARLETLIREVIQRQLLAGKSDRVPQEFEGLVENYFRRLSEDTGEAEAEAETRTESREDAGDRNSNPQSQASPADSAPPAR
ncbi:MAG: hypothetical protein V4726_14600 [Verrucomicrobiota bacterium]